MWSRWLELFFFAAVLCRRFFGNCLYFGFLDYGYWLRTLVQNQRLNAVLDFFLDLDHSAVDEEQHIVRVYDQFIENILIFFEVEQTLVLDYGMRLLQLFVGHFVLEYCLEHEILVEHRINYLENIFSLIHYILVLRSDGDWLLFFFAAGGEKSGNFIEHI